MVDIASRKVTSVGIGAHMRMVHTEDPKKKLLAEIGKVPDEVVMFTRILVAVYRRPEKTKGGIILTDRANEEDVWQGKVGLVIKKGPLAYKDDEVTKFQGYEVEEGDWVWFRPSDGMACQVNGVPCRIFKEDGIIGRINHPEEVW